jgi:hypothetical protein
MPLETYNFKDVPGSPVPKIMGGAPFYVCFNLILICENLRNLRINISFCSTKSADPLKHSALSLMYMCFYLILICVNPTPAMQARRGGRVCGEIFQPSASNPRFPDGNR